MKNIVCADLLPFLQQHQHEFDLIIARDVLEHFAKAEVVEILRLTKQALTPTGRLNTDMGVGTLLKSIALLTPKLPQVKYIVAGEKGDSFNALQRLAAKYPKHVFYTTIVPFNELPNFYAAASIIVAPTQGLRACGSLAAIEAMSTGKPVIATNIGCIPEIVQDNITGKLVRADNAEALANSITALCVMEPTALTLMGKAGRKHVEQHFNKKLLDEQFEQLFRTLATNKTN